MTAPYIPPKDADLNNWLNNFANLITAAPSTYGLDSTAALAIQNAVDDWNTAYALVIVPATKTSVTVAAKNVEKVAATQLCRTYGSQIRLNPGVLNSDKLALGLNLPNNSPSPIGAPATFPLIEITNAGPLIHVLRYADNTTPSIRAKPAGSVAMELRYGAAALALATPEDCPNVVNITKQPAQVNFVMGESGKLATYFARWQNRKGQVGPWSAQLTFIVP